MRIGILVSVVGITGVLSSGACERTHKPVGGSMTAGPAAASSASLADIVSEVLPSVVSISSIHALRDLPPEVRERFDGQQEIKVRGLGSGVVVGRGLVVTNHHVVNGADEIAVKVPDRRELKAHVIAVDSKSDLAVLCMAGDTGALRPIKWGDSSRVRLGDTVIAIGDPFGLGETVTVGVVSAKGRTDLGILDYENFTQTDAAMNPGSSGGALINAQGELVGINTAILSRTGGYMGIGFAIPSNTARPITESLVRTGRVSRGWLGIDTSDSDVDLAKARRATRGPGVLVTGISHDAPAARAGLALGDVIERVNGEDVESTGRLKNMVASAGARARLSLDVWHGGKRMKIVVSLVEEPADARTSDKTSPPGRHACGRG
jgi:serine protease Do